MALTFSLASLLICICSACGLSNRPDVCGVLESECIRNCLVHIFVAGFVETYSVLFSLALHTYRQPYIGAILFVKTPHLSSGIPKRVFILQSKI